MDVDFASKAPIKPKWNKDSSGESSNPEKWFEKSNKNVRKNQSSFGDGKLPK
jgi:hypothetical protein